MEHLNLEGLYGALFVFAVTYVCVIGAIAADLWSGVRKADSEMTAGQMMLLNEYMVKNE